MAFRLHITAPNLGDKDYPSQRGALEAERGRRGNGGLA